MSRSKYVGQQKIFNMQEHNVFFIWIVVIYDVEHIFNYYQLEQHNASTSNMFPFILL